MSMEFRFKTSPRRKPPGVEFTHLLTGTPLIHIALHELSRLFKNFSLIGSLFLVFITSIPCLIILRNDHMVLHQDYLDGLVSVDEQVAKLRGYSEFPLRLHLPPRPLTFLSRGAFERVDPSFEFSRLTPPRLVSRAGRGSWLRYFFPPLDVTTLVVLLFSVIPYSFGYRSFCGEKREGTLKLILVNPISRRQLILGKLMGLTAGLAGPFVVMMGLLVATILLTPTIRLKMDQSQWIHFGTFIGTAGVYSLLNLLAAVLVSVVASRPATALISLVGLWLGSSVIVPALGMEIAEHTAPSQPAAEQRTQHRNLNNALLKEYEKMLQNIGYQRLHIPLAALEKPGLKYFQINLGDERVMISRDGEFSDGGLTDDTKARIVAEIPALAERQRRLYTEKEALYRNTKDLMLKQWESARLAEWLSPSFLFAGLTAEIVGSGPQQIASQLDGLLHSVREFFDLLESRKEFRSELFLSLATPLQQRTSFVPETELLNARNWNASAQDLRFGIRYGYLCILLLLLACLIYRFALNYDPR